MNPKEIEKKAEDLRKQLGGTIFAFPINEADPLSKYAVVMYAGEKYHVYPECTDVSQAAVGVKTILEQLAKHGMDADYQRNVRFIHYEAQMNAPSVTMRRLKKDPTTHTNAQPIADYTPRDDGEAGYYVSARGVLKFSYLSMVDDNLPKAKQFMDEYYKLLAMRRYGKTAAAIRQEVRRMNKDQGVKWIEATYRKYIHDDTEIMNILQTLGGTSP